MSERLAALDAHCPRNGTTARKQVDYTLADARKLHVMILRVARFRIDCDQVYSQT
jgi:hypothetical protein